VFIKAITKRNRISHKSYTYHRLLESYRSSRGPRHEILLNLGRLDLPKEQWKSLADRIEAILSGQRQLAPAPENIEVLAQHYASLLKQRRATQSDGSSAREAPEPILRMVDLRSVRTKTVRSVGAEHIGVEYARRLGLERALVEAGLSEHEARVGLLLAVGRLVAPASELSTFAWVRHRSGLSELVGSWAKGVSLSALYRTSDALYEHRQRIEELLQGEERRLFGLEEKVILYDLTNTYFEGSKYSGSDLAYGKSKDRRSDCLLMTVGLVVDEWGFPKRSGIFAGNVSEPSTMEQMLKELGAPAGATVVMDAGIGKTENLVRLREQGYHYISVARDRPLAEGGKGEEGMVVIKAEGEQLIRGRLVKSGEEWILRCRSEQRRAKEQGMKERFEKRFEEGLEAIAAGLGKKRTTKSYEKILQRIGRLKERSHGIHRYYDIEVKQRDGRVEALRWSLSRPEEAEQRYSGEYFLRTSRHDLDEKSLWELYVTLGGIEDSFRSLKSELGLRPVFHSKASRVKAHLFVSILAYHLLSAIRHRLRSQGYLMRWATVRQRMSTHVVSTVSMKTESGTKVSIRTPSTPEVFHRDIYRALGIRMNPIPTRRAERQKV
jgi:transposase